MTAQDFLCKARAMDEITDRGSPVQSIKGVLLGVLMSEGNDLSLHRGLPSNAGKKGTESH
ncbi:MAG: hypothetical protein DMG16_02585 [Acidobacteria bacterium]|nr:MAG: hypothetical protein DMG16_02585 [Acidobacteriota bacterium]